METRRCLHPNHRPHNIQTTRKNSNSNNNPQTPTPNPRKNHASYNRETRLLQRKHTLLGYDMAALVMLGTYCNLYANIALKGFEGLVW